MYKFKSRITGDLIMLEPNGRQILKIINKLDEVSPSKGILLPEQMPDAISALKDAVERDDVRRKQLIEQAMESGAALPVSEGISLRQRAKPFIDMMHRCHKAEKEIVWGV